MKICYDNRNCLPNGLEQMMDATDYFEKGTVDPIVNPVVQPS